MSTTPRTCKCGCGESVRGRRVFIDKEHQLLWMAAGGARELNQLQPLEAKVRGGKTSGHQAAESGRLLEASAAGAERAKEIAASFRKKHRKRMP